jgi:hypothetical protein
LLSAAGQDTVTTQMITSSVENIHRRRGSVGTESWRRDD